MWQTSSSKFLIIILFIAALLRIVGLGYPRAYIFDEVYHAFTAREYKTGNIDAWEWWTTPPPGVAYEWTHPPVAKYGMVIGMLIFGENSFGWRIGSAIFGVLSILGIYQLVYLLFKDKNLALLSAFLVSIEGTHIAQSRIAMNDIYMLCFYIWSLYCAIKSKWKMAAILYGLSLATKWSALYGVIPLAMMYLYSSRLTIRSILFSVQLLFIVIFVYILSFAPFIIQGHTWPQWWELQRQMWYYHTHLVATHGYQSTPRDWLFDVRPVWYYVNYLDKAISNIYVIGNPIILWTGLIAVILQLKKLLSYPVALLYVLYFIFFLPWVFSPRIMFYYHYLPSSVFLSVILALMIRDLPRSIQYAVVILAVFGLLFIAPMLYGIPMSQTFWDQLFGIFVSWK